ncbi:hypothetical protein H1S04_16810 [Paracoccus sp. S1E-3]|nr:hypothetical protein [Paracoccus sp. S1E-3]
MARQAVAAARGALRAPGKQLPSDRRVVHRCYRDSRACVKPTCKAEGPTCTAQPGAAEAGFAGRSL